MTANSSESLMLNPKTSDQNPWAIFLVFLKLGLTSFGGPIAHLGYFRHEFVRQRQWLTERSYADLVALCHFLPGPTSSQVGMALGLSRSGYAGALAAWAGFTLPSALILILFALGITNYGNSMPSGVLHGLELVAVAVVAQAVWGMARNLCPDLPRITLMIAATCFTLLLPTVLGQLAVIVLAAAVGLIAFKPQLDITHDELPLTMSPRAGRLWLTLFLALLIGLPLLAFLSSHQTILVLDAFYRSGALVFGGGHVVLPLLQAEVVHSGLVTNETFLAGYGVAQAVPGPLFTFAAFLGASITSTVNPWLTGLLCLLAIFAPSFLLIAGTLPFWERLRRNRRMQASLLGINAAVVGILLAVLYQPVWTNTIQTPHDFVLALLAFTAIRFWKLPIWLVVFSSALLGTLLTLVY